MSTDDAGTLGPPTDVTPADDTEPVTPTGDDVRTGPDSTDEPEAGAAEPAD